MSILVATKDRHDQLQKLLDSICKSTFLPDKVVIVFAGREISSITSLFERTLNIEVIHSVLANQVSQKSLGIKALGSSHEWVFFLDDDVVLEVDTIEKMFTEYLTNPVFEEYVGFGLSILNRSTRKINSAILKFLKMFSLLSESPGAITKSGHAQSYLDNPVEIEVQWLNGISVWKSKVLYQYSNDQNNQSYSAYEDVNFSYKISKSNKILFGPKARVINQKIEGNTPLTINQFLSGGYHRYRFVSTNAELSQWRLLVAQLIRGLDFIFRSNESSSIIARIKTSLNLWVKLFILVLKHKNIDD